MAKMDTFFYFLKKVHFKIKNIMFECKKNYVLEKDLKFAQLEYIPKVNLKFKFASIEDLERLNYKDYNFNNSGFQLAKKWLLNGDSCLLGYIENKIVTYLWINFKIRELYNLNLRLGGNKVFFFKTFTRADMRGLGINPACLNEAIKIMQLKGYEKVYIDVNTKNYSSINAIEKIGFVHIGVFYKIRILGLEKVFISQKLLNIIES